MLLSEATDKPRVELTACMHAVQGHSRALSLRVHNMMLYKIFCGACNSRSFVKEILVNCALRHLRWNLKVLQDFTCAGPHAVSVHCTTVNSMQCDRVYFPAPACQSPCGVNTASYTVYQVGVVSIFIACAIGFSMRMRTKLETWSAKAKAGLSLVAVLPTHWFVPVPACEDRHASRSQALQYCKHGFKRSTRFAPSFATVHTLRMHVALGWYVA